MSKTQQYTVTVNGNQEHIVAEPRELLIYTLREKLNLTGSHIGCETSHCGACTVIMNGKSVKACTVFISQADNAEITTIEGLGNSENPHPIQEAFREHHGLQCGYCTPGMITRAAILLEENSNPTEEEIRFGMAGNICRCTGYQKIVKSIKAAATSINAAREAAE